MAHCFSNCKQVGKNPEILQLLFTLKNVLSKRRIPHAITVPFSHLPLFKRKVEEKQNKIKKPHRSEDNIQGLGKKKTFYEIKQGK